MTDNRTRLLSIVSRELGTIETITNDPLDATFSGLKGDSLHRISIMCEVEEEFGIEISDEDDERLGPDATLRTLLALIEWKLHLKNPELSEEGQRTFNLLRELLELQHAKLEN